MVVASPQQEENRDADELDEIDALPLQDPDDDASTGSFFDARDYASTDSGAYFSGESYGDDDSASSTGVIGRQSCII